MQSKALLSTADIEAYSKCAQFHIVIYPSGTSDSALNQARRIIKKKGHINFQIPSTSLIWPGKEFKGSTLLHISCYNPYAGLVSEDLLNLGADFTIKNKQGDTALHSVFKAPCFHSGRFLSYKDNSHINLILSAHVRFGNPCNPCNNDGFSHLHIACMANHVRAVEFFLKNGVDVNQAVHQETKTYAGFTALHFAIKQLYLETVEVLLKYGVNKSIENGYKMTPLQQLLKQRIDILGSPTLHTRTTKVKEDLEKKGEITGRIIFMLMGDNFLDKVDIIDSTGLTSFHIACTMQDFSKVENLLEQIEDIDHCINIDSPMWPGYTALHFATSCNNISIVELLVQKRGASLDKKNADGLTPLDICIQNGHLKDVHAAISLKPELANILFSDNVTRLVIFLSLIQDPINLKSFLEDCVDNVNMTLPNDSPLWPGYTPLHVAVTLSRSYLEQDEIQIYPSELGSILVQIEELLQSGADVTMKDASGRTPLHYAFREDKTKVCELLRKRHRSSVNPVDEENLSHLHIACAENDESLIRKLLLSDDVDVNISYRGEEATQKVKPGWTPLNCASSYGNIRKILLHRGAREFSLKEEPRDTNTLHYACENGDKDAVQRLLNNGADVDLVLKKGKTPLHLALYRYEISVEIVELLLQQGANLNISDDRNNTPLTLVFAGHIFTPEHNVKVYRRMVVSMLKQHEETQRRIEEETGITMLHIACYMLDVEDVKSKLENRINVDARVREDSKLWPGCTSLHVLMTKVKHKLSEEETASDVNVITELLLKKGTDVALVNTDKDTPVHISYYSKDDDNVSRTESLLKHHRNFLINPADSHGLSYFHIAVLIKNIEIVEKFLEHGVDVNQPPDFFENTHNGCTPLHMAINNVDEQTGMRIVELLLSHGADVNLENAYGNSALHFALNIGSTRLNLMEKLISLGANINCEDVNGLTPFESLLCSDSISAEDIRFFLEHGCNANACNPSDDEGYVGIILAKKDKTYRDLLLEEMIQARNFKVNEFRRTLMHNSVAAREVAITSEEYVGLFKRFEGFGCDVDDQDHTGQTALHLAAKFNNEQAVTALLNSGADSNIVNFKNKSALSYALEPCTNCTDHDRKSHYHWNIVKALVIQALKLDYLDLDVDRFNYGEILRSYRIVDPADTNPKEDFVKEISDAKNFTINSLHLTVGDFLSEMGAVIRYSRLTEESRDIVDEAFELIHTRYKEILPILKLQYRKAVARFRLVERVADLKLLLGFPMPALCADIILSFLTMKDLKNVVRAVDLLN